MWRRRLHHGDGDWESDPGDATQRQRMHAHTYREKQAQEQSSIAAASYFQPPTFEARPPRESPPPPRQRPHASSGAAGHGSVAQPQLRPTMPHSAGVGPQLQWAAAQHAADQQAAGSERAPPAATQHAVPHSDADSAAAQPVGPQGAGRQSPAAALRLAATAQASAAVVDPERRSKPASCSPSPAAGAAQRQGSHQHYNRVPEAAAVPRPALPAQLQSAQAADAAPAVAAEGVGELLPQPSSPAPAAFAAHLQTAQLTTDSASAADPAQQLVASTRQAIAATLQAEPEPPPPSPPAAFTAVLQAARLTTDSVSAADTAQQLTVSAAQAIAATLQTAPKPPPLPPPSPPGAFVADLQPAQLSTDSGSAGDMAQQLSGGSAEVAAEGQRLAAPQQAAAERMAGAAAARKPTKRRSVQRKLTRRKPTRKPALLDLWWDPVRNRQPTENRHGAPPGQTVNWAMVDHITYREKRRFGAYGPVTKLPQRVRNAIAAAIARVSSLGPGRVQLQSEPCLLLCLCLPAADALLFAHMEQRVQVVGGEASRLPW